MSLPEIAVLFFVMMVLALVPSTSVALVVARSSTAGFMNGAAVAAGIVAGDLVFVLLAAFGMTALAEVMGSLFLILRYLVGAYLIWFGIGLLKSPPSPAVATPVRPGATLSASFLSGLSLTLSDVKAIFFYASLFPVFVDLTTVKVLDIAIIAIVTIVAVGGVKLGYAYSAMRVVSLAQGSMRERVIRVTAGGFMVCAGTYLMAIA